MEASKIASQGLKRSREPVPGSRLIPETWYPWFLIGLLWVVACLNYLDRLMLVSVRDSVKETIAMSDAQFGLLTSVFLWVYGALSPFGGYIADRFSRKWVIVGSLGVWSLLTWATAHVTTFQSLVLVRALMGISEAFYMPAGLALIAEWHRGRTRSLATGIHMTGLYAGAALGGVGGYIAEYSRWQNGFTWFGLLGIGYALVLLFLLRSDLSRGPEGVSAPEAPDKREIRWAGAVRSLFAQRSFLALIAYFSLASLASWGIVGWLPTFLREHFSLGLGKAGLSATGYIQIGSYIGVLLGGFIADRWTRQSIRARIYVVVIGFCIGGPSLFLMAGTHVFAVAVAGILLYGLARGFSDANTMPVLCQIVDGKYRATGYGFLNLFSTFTGGAMILAGGMLRDANVSLSAVFKVSAGGLVIAGLILLLVRPAQAEEK